MIHLHNNAWQGESTFHPMDSHDTLQNPTSQTYRYCNSFAYSIIYSLEVLMKTYFKCGQETQNHKIAGGLFKKKILHHKLWNQIEIHLVCMKDVQ